MRKYRKERKMMINSKYGMLVVLLITLVICITGCGDEDTESDEDLELKVLTQEQILDTEEMSEFLNNMEVVECTITKRQTNESAKEDIVYMVGNCETC